MDKETGFHSNRFVFLTNPCEFQFIYFVLCHLLSN